MRYNQKDSLKMETKNYAGVIMNQRSFYQSNRTSTARSHFTEKHYLLFWKRRDSFQMIPGFTIVSREAEDYLIQNEEWIGCFSNSAISF